MSGRKQSKDAPISFTQEEVDALTAGGNAAAKVRQRLRDQRQAARKSSKPAIEKIAQRQRIGIRRCLIRNLNSDLPQSPQYAINVIADFGIGVGQNSDCVSDISEFRFLCCWATARRTHLSWYYR